MKGQKEIVEKTFVVTVIKGTGQRRSRAMSSPVLTRKQKPRGLGSSPHFSRPVIFANRITINSLT